MWNIFSACIFLFKIGLSVPGLSSDCGSTRKSQPDWLISEAERISTSAYSPARAMAKRDDGAGEGWRGR
jgi:hypothetical protein